MQIRALIFIIFFIVSNTLSAQNSCCEMQDCKDKAEKLAREITISVAYLGKDPNNYQQRDKILDSFRIVDEYRYLKIVELIKNIDKFNNGTLGGLSCINEFIDEEDVLDWMTHFFLKYENVKGLSPEFCKGFGLHFDLNTGVGDLFRASESFSSSSRLLLSYTFSKKACGGRVRVLLGPSFYYQGREAFLLINPRTEIRLLDIGNDLLSIGNLKLIGQANFNNKILITGLGVSIELDNFGAQVMGEYQTGKLNYSIQTGIFYRFRI